MSTTNRTMEDIQNDQLMKSYASLYKSIVHDYAIDQDDRKFEGKVSALISEMRNKGFTANEIEEHAIKVKNKVQGNKAWWKFW